MEDWFFFKLSKTAADTSRISCETFLVARKIGGKHLGLYASPAYLGNALGASKERI